MTTPSEPHYHHQPLDLALTEGLGRSPKRACETCRYVMQRGGNTWADQRCRAFPVGRSHMMTWTATRDPKRCGPDRQRWAPQPPA